MQVTQEHINKIKNLKFFSVYPHYVTKIEKKGRTLDELFIVIEWLTGFDKNKVHQLIEEKVSFESFFQQATIHSNAHKITGLICGYRIEEIEDELTRNVRYLDKLVDELAKGRALAKILRE